MKKTWAIVSAFIFCTTLYGAGHRVITIAGTADLLGAMEPSSQKIDLDGDGKKETVQMGGVARISTIFKNIKK